MSYGRKDSHRSGFVNIHEDDGAFGSWGCSRGLQERVMVGSDGREAKHNPLLSSWA